MSESSQKPSSPPKNLNNSLDPNLPIVKHFLRLSEENSKIVIDISDETGGLGLKILFEPDAAYKFGYDIMEKARNAVSRGSDDPIRKGIMEVKVDGKVL
jgi:hypothetical protein